MIAPTSAELELFGRLRPARLAHQGTHSPDELFDAACRWGVAPLLGALSPTSSPRLHQTLLVATAKHLLLRATYRLICHCWEQAKVSHAPLKGLALGPKLYASPQARTMCDLDLLVPHEQLQRATSALLDTPGFSLKGGMRPGPWRRAQKDVCLIYQEGKAAKVPVEVHYRLDQFKHLSLDYGEIWQRTSRVGLLAHLDATDELILTAYHLARSNYPLRFIWFLDVYGLATRGDVDWEALLERSGRWGCRRALWAVFARAEGILRERFVPPHVLAALAPKAHVQRYLATLLPAASPATRFDGGGIRLPQLLLWLPMMDGWKHRARFVSTYLGVRAADGLHRLASTLWAAPQGQPEA